MNEFDDAETAERLKRFEREREELEYRIWNDAARQGATDGLLDIGDGFYVVTRWGSPVQYCGVVDGLCFYFKSRGSSWHFTLARTAEACTDSYGACSYEVECEYHAHASGEDDQYAASYMELDQAERLIKSCYALWKLGRIESK